MSRKIIGIIVFVIIVLITHLAMAEEPNAKPQEKTAIKTLSGEVSGISNSFLAIVYDQDKKTSYEMTVVIDKNTKVEHRNNLKDIRSGDTVSVEYEEKTEVIDEETSRIKSRIAKTITFLRAAPEGLRSQEEAVEPDVSEEETTEPEVSGERIRI